MNCILQKVRRDAMDAALSQEHVVIDAKAVREAAMQIGQLAKRPPDWDRELQFSDSTERTADWVFVVDSLNFCFWPDDGEKRWTVEYAGERRRGYFALTCALKKALLSGELDLSCEALADTTPESLSRILRGDGPVPMLEDRARILRENARILLESFKGSFSDLVRSCDKSASRLVRSLYDHFPTFRDEAIFRGRKTIFIKRAQILVSDLFGAFSGNGLGEFRDLHLLTAFADYRIPQILRSMKMLVYSPSLADTVDSGKRLSAGSEEEVSIRACTVHAVELMVNALRDAGVKTATAFGLDWMLWNLSHNPQHNLKPYHLTRTIFY